MLVDIVHVSVLNLDRPNVRVDLVALPVDLVSCHQTLQVVPVIEELLELLLLPVDKNDRVVPVKQGLKLMNLTS